MIPLPLCRWRGEEQQGRYPCSSHKIHAPIGVTDKLCLNCALCNHEPITDPSLLEKIINFGIAAVRHALAGLPQTPPEEINRRLTICKGCVSLRDDGTCRSCGCGIKTKAAWLEQKCPMNKW